MQEAPTDGYLCNSDVSNVVSGVRRRTSVNDGRGEVVHIVMATSKGAEVQHFGERHVGWYLHFCHQFPCRGRGGGGGMRGEGREGGRERGGGEGKRGGGEGGGDEALQKLYTVWPNYTVLSTEHK